MIWVMYLWSSWIYIRRRELSMRMGLNFGIIHMVMIPMTVFAFRGELAGDPGGLIPAVSWVTHSGSVLKILGMVGIYGLVDMVCHSFPQPDNQKLGIGATFWASLPGIKPMYLIVGFIVLSIALFVVTGVASGGHWAHAKGDFLATKGTTAVLALQLYATVRLATLVVLAASYLYGQVTIKWFVLWMSLLCALDLYTTGNRIFTLQMLVALAGILIVKERWFQLGMMGLAVLPFGVLMVMFPMIRSAMHKWSGSFRIGTATTALGEGFQEATEYYGPDLGISNFLLGVTEGINVNVLIVVVEDFHSIVGRLNGTGLLRGLVFWIPRSVWPGKPENLTVLIGQYLMGGGSQGVSMGATIFGEFWANFGFLGVFVMPVVFYCTDFVLRRLIVDPVMRVVMVLVFGFTVVRLPVSDFIVLSLFVIVLLNMSRIAGTKPAV